MDDNLQNIKVIRNESESRFELHIDRYIAISEYRVIGNTITFYHVGVPPELEGQGLGSLLAKASLDYAREKSYKVVPACSFISAYIHRHPEYQSLM
jgi:hypothetical protein